jgi:hypothetical protein
MCGAANHPMRIARTAATMLLSDGVSLSTTLGDSPTDFMLTKADLKPELISPSELDAVLEQARIAGWRELTLFGPLRAEWRPDLVRSSTI